MQAWLKAQLLGGPEQTQPQPPSRSNSKAKKPKTPSAVTPKEPSAPEPKPLLEWLPSPRPSQRPKLEWLPPPQTSQPPQQSDTTQERRQLTGRLYVRPPESSTVKPQKLPQRESLLKLGDRPLRPDQKAPFDTPWKNKQTVDAIVIGAGPAGISAVGNLLRAMPDAKIWWVDRTFDGGSIGRYYRELPSYSSVGEYLRFATTPSIFQTILDNSPQPNAFTAMSELDPEMTCPLHLVGDLLTMLTDGLRVHARVRAVYGTVQKLVRHPKENQWTATLEAADGVGTAAPRTRIRAPMVVFCTGARPIVPEPSLPTPILGLESSLSPTRLAKILPRNQPRTIAVIGNGHSAVLVLRNLFRLAATTHRQLRIRWFTRSEHFKYTGTWTPGNADTDAAKAIKRRMDMGLDAGEAANFARTMLDGDRLHKSDAGAYITRHLLPPIPSTSTETDRIAREQKAIIPHLHDVHFTIHAVGFARARMPEVRPSLDAAGSPIGRPKRLIFNALKGSFFPDGSSRHTVIGLFGAGAAFPELKLTLEGWRKPAVSIPKFHGFITRMISKWIRGTKTGYLPHHRPWNEDSLIQPRQRGSGSAALNLNPPEDTYASAMAYAQHGITRKLTPPKSHKIRYEIKRGGVQARRDDQSERRETSWGRKQFWRRKYLEGLEEDEQTPEAREKLAYYQSQMVSRVRREQHMKWVGEGEGLVERQVLGDGRSLEEEDRLLGEERRRAREGV
ncbi:uncharacterized protein C8A04DRAFT_13504 [Dichotomopilus funicola]|uniref:L-ornithine N(5)-monooxygenase [NAD(P)H] n=1 Tax=Dichotomopilus funicola TaxID=1934379 RepID=A0AAN6V0E3_9PEZI|nr:hypothetical protein C8A04DRAFT_13504 [Dichotomopilus funicola]